MVHHSRPSFVMVGGCLRGRGLSHVAFRVAVELSSYGTYVSERGVYIKCWPSVSTLAKDSETSDRTVKRALKELAEKGVIIGEERYSASGAQLTTSYTVIVHSPGVSGATSRTSDGGTSAASNGVPQMTGGDDTGVTQPRTSSYPKPKNQKNPPTPRRVRKAAATTAPVVVGSTNLAKAEDIVTTLDGIDPERLVPHVCDALNRGIDADALATSLATDLPDVVHDMTSLMIYRARSARPGRSVNRSGRRSGTGPIPACGPIDAMFADVGDADCAWNPGDGMRIRPAESIAAALSVPVA